MILRNASVYTSGHVFSKGSLCIRGGRIVENTASCLHHPDRLLQPLPGEEIIDASGLLALPGLVDIHFHGAAGHDFSNGDPAGLDVIAAYEAAHGITAICPAVMTLPEEKLNAAMDNAASFCYSAGLAAPKKNSLKADLVGINLEGPFISPKKAGAQDPKYILPANEAMLVRLQARSGGLIRLVTVAPEEPGSLEFIRSVSASCDPERRVRISLGHTAADYETAKAAFQAGAKQLTHLFNAMPGITHREPGPIIAAYEEGADVELIADGIHIHPAMVRFAFHVFGKEHVILISDSMEAAGLKDGSYELGGQRVRVTGKKAVLFDHPETIAGSVTNLYDCMKSAVLEMGIPLEDAVRASSENPARAIGVEEDYGSLREGAFGNVILAREEDLSIVSVLKKGFPVSSLQILS